MRIDSSTDYMIELAPPTQDTMTRDQAELYCITLTYNGHYDWRLPTYREYTSMPPYAIWILDGVPPWRNPTVVLYYVIPVRTI